MVSRGWVARGGLGPPVPPVDVDPSLSGPSVKSVCPCEKAVYVRVSLGGQSMSVFEDSLSSLAKEYFPVRW